MIRAQAARSLRESTFGVDPETERRRRFNDELTASGLSNSGEGTKLASAFEAEEERMRRADAKRTRIEAEQRRVDLEILRANTMTSRAGSTEGFDDDRAAAAALRVAELEEARVRIMNDETIPAQERYNRLLADTDSINAQQVQRLKAIDDLEAERNRRQKEMDKAKAKSIELFEEQLAIEEAAALGKKALVRELQAEADLRRRIEEIDRLGLTGQQRARAEESARAIYDAQRAEPQGTNRIIGFSGIPGGETLMRQMAGGGGPQARVLEVARKQVRVLEQIRDKIGAAPAVAG
jgi:hypothetical protein